MTLVEAINRTKTNMDVEAWHPGWTFYIWFERGLFQSSRPAQINIYDLNMEGWGVRKRGHDFTWALEEIRAGRAVRHRDWTHKDSFLDNKGGGQVSIAQALDVRGWVSYDGE